MKLEDCFIISLCLENWWEHKTGDEERELSVTVREWVI